MKRPSFQFYPGDWLSNPNLRRCTFGERGVWLEVMCLMHDQEPYGVLTWPLKEIAQTVGCKVPDLLSLQRKSVLKGSDTYLDEPFVYVPRSGRKEGDPVILVPTQAGPIWYSSRMVRDEYVRTNRGASDGKGDAPKHPPKPAPKPPIGGAFGPRDAGTRAAPSSSSSSSPSENTEAQGARNGASAHHAPDDPPPEAAGFQPTRAGLVCRAMKAAGMQAVNPGDPRLLALLEQGATSDEFAGLAAEAVAKSPPRGFAWVLATLEGRRRDASAIALAPKVDAPPPTVPSHDAERTQGYLAEQERRKAEAQSEASHEARRAAMAKLQRIGRSA